MRVQRGSTGTALFCPNLALDGWVVGAIPWLLYPQEEPQYSLEVAG
jgi:hypothetical protein